MKNELIVILDNMMNGDAISDIQTFNDFVIDFIDYMEDRYSMESSEVMNECGLVYMRGRK